MNKTTHIFIALFCLSSQVIMSSQTQPTNHTLNPFAGIILRSDLTAEEKRAAMTTHKKTLIREFERKHSASDVVVVRYFKHLDALQQEALECLDRDASAQ